MLLIFELFIKNTKIKLKNFIYRRFLFFWRIRLEKERYREIMGNGYKKSKGFISFIFIKTKILTNKINTFKKY
jgi:hypothetical protein